MGNSIHVSLCVATTWFELPYCPLLYVLSDAAEGYEKDDLVIRSVRNRQCVTHKNLRRTERGLDSAF
jgi:hypothetical protein